jgi:hypothetical protein
MVSKVISVYVIFTPDNHTPLPKANIGGNLTSFAGEISHLTKLQGLLPKSKSRSQRENVAVENARLRESKKATVSYEATVAFWMTLHYSGEINPC